jgi:hypothetical protein
MQYHLTLQDLSLLLSDSTLPKFDDGGRVGITELILSAASRRQDAYHDPAWSLHSRYLAFWFFHDT